MLFDAHNHLQDERLAPHLPAIVPELHRIGLGRAVVNGTREADWDRVAALAQEHRWILPSYGLHPWFTKERTPDWKERLAARVENGHAAVGEIGLDRWIEGADLDDQREVFTWQLALAARHNLPASLHCLKAWGALWEILSTHPLPECGFLLHSYGGPAEMVEGFLKRGAYFSFSGYFLHGRKADRREIFRALPPGRLLVETDAPDMPPPPDYRPFPLPDGPGHHPLNHPANLQTIYKALARLRGESLETLTAQVAENFERLFGGALNKIRHPY